jgi:hypothetical protein
MEDVSGDIKTEINPETQLTTTAVDGWIACAQQVPISPFFIESQSQYDGNNARVKKHQVKQGLMQCVDAC